MEARLTVGSQGSYPLLTLILCSHALSFHEPLMNNPSTPMPLWIIRIVFLDTTTVIADVTQFLLAASVCKGSVFTTVKRHAQKCDGPHGEYR